jgi:hypothetical protein
MTDRPKHDPTRATKDSGEQRSGNEAVPEGFIEQHGLGHESGYGGKIDQPRNPYEPGRSKRGGDLRDADLHDAPIEDPDDTLAD